MPKLKEQDQDDNPIVRDSYNTSFEEILTRYISRRFFIKSTALTSASLVLAGTPCFANEQITSLRFEEIAHGLDEHLHLAKNHSVQVILKWGDSLYSDESPFDPTKQNAKSQARRFGYNNDFVAYLPISNIKKMSTHGLLIVNHEYVSSVLMHPGSPGPFELTRQQVETEMFAHGLSVVEIQKQKNKWKINHNSKFNRRITPFTAMKLSGPARNHKRVKTEYSPSGNSCYGTFGNCAGCTTPWGTVLTAEENVQAYFMGNTKNTDEYESYKRFGLFGNKSVWSIWGKYHEHWDLDKHPQAAMHAGWVVEFDPYNSTFVPIKRTALGRCKHEGCDVHINKDGKAVVYMGDDQAFEYVYRFVSKEKVIPGNQKHNLSLLDSGELSVAEFTDQGSLIWHPLQYGTAPLTKANGFNTQADVVLDMRKAADLVGATPMDRPEEIKVNPKSGRVFAVFTNNVRRNPFHIDAANPRALNRHGHILELIPPQQDHSAREFKWDVFILAGDPNSKIDQALYHTELSENGWFSCPDNCSFDENGNIWIATDGFNRCGKADGIWVSATIGRGKALSKQFLRAPIGAEICSPCFTPDHKTMFCSIQHPADGSSYNQPSTRWPDFDENIPPRPAVIAITHDQDEKIGS